MQTLSVREQGEREPGMEKPGIEGLDLTALDRLASFSLGTAEELCEIHPRIVLPRTRGRVYPFYPSVSLPS